MKELSFAEKNVRNFTLKEGVVRNYELLGTSIEKLRKKYVNMKTEWRKLTDRIKRSSGLSPINETKWHKILNEIFAEKRKDLAVSARAADSSFSLNEESELNTSSSEEMKKATVNKHRSMQQKRRKKARCCNAQKEKSGEVADTRIESASYNLGHNILRLFSVLLNFHFTTSETNCDY